MNWKARILLVVLAASSFSGNLFSYPQPTFQQPYVNLIKPPHTPPHYHFLADLSYNKIKLEDGSEWKFSFENAGEVVRDWQRGDRVALFPKNEQESDWGYILRNKRDGSVIKVSPLLGPERYGQNSYWVVGFPQKNQVTLTNSYGEKFTYIVRDEDAYLLSSWKIDHHVIPASNWSCAICYFFTNPNNRMLINVHKAQIAFAKELK